MAPHVICDLCPHFCRIGEGQSGFCHARTNQSGQIVSRYYGKLIPLTLDPIEKKPLFHFRPGRMILSAGSLGCNMACPFCQNHSIAKPGNFSAQAAYLQPFTPQEVIGQAERTRAQGNIGIAFTYNEPLINFEFVLNTFKLIDRETNPGNIPNSERLQTILISNGQINDPYRQILLPHVDAWNIDLKCFSAEGYRRLGGELITTLQTIEQAQAVSHVEVTSLIVPGLNDDPHEMKRQCQWLSALDPHIPLHLSRFFPSHQMRAKAATPLDTLRRLRSIAQDYLSTVHLGNVPAGV